ncbi:MAG: hypothetical protein JWO82_3814 [Akkermansiaceae bacterium]|nr:hypothetical protein [Akkermansiaceae bacterium]
MKSLVHLLAICSCLAAVPHAGAQQAPAAKEADQGRHIRGLSFRIEEPLDVAYVYAPKIPGVKIEVKGYLNDISSALPMEGGTDLVLTNSADPASVKDPAAILAKAKIAPTLKSAVFMFLPGTNKAGDPKYRLLVLEDSVNDFPAGSLKLMNLSPLPVRMQLETKNFDVKSGQILVIKDPPMGDNQHASMSVFSFKGDKWQSFGSSVMPAPGRARVFQVFYENPASGKVEMRGIRDVAFGD